jgi:F-type H+-transporting ATPase subunit delta
MASNPRLAARYAKSFLDFSLEKGQLEEAYQDMVLIRDTCKASRELLSILRSPVIQEEKKGKILNAIFAGKVSVITREFVRLVILKDREGHVPEIAEAFIRQYKEHKGISIVRLTTAVPVSEALKKSIVDKVRAERQLGEVELESEVRQELIGGFILEIGDLRMDSSVAFELSNVRKQFQNNDFVYKIR